MYNYVFLYYFPETEVGSVKVCLTLVQKWAL